MTAIHRDDHSWIQTYSGLQFWPLSPRPEDVRIEDIAHALSMKCRYAGHCREFYSVAQHSVLVSENVPPADALWGLLHDAGEAYFADIVRPIKKSHPIFDEIEAAIMASICDAFGLPPDQPESVSRADVVLLMTERRDLLATPPRPWSLRAEPLEEHIVPMQPFEAEAVFLSRFRSLMSARDPFHAGTIDGAHASADCDDDLDLVYREAGE
jgi:hypothetical protein